MQNQENWVGVNPHKNLLKNQEEYLKYINDFNELTQNQGIIITNKQLETVQKIYNGYLKNTKAVDKLNGCEFEHPFIIEDPIMGKIKGKVDGINVEEGYVVEIKTSSMFTNTQEFREASKERDYDLQAVMYCLMAEFYYKKPFDHYFIVCNTKEPFNVELYKTSNAYLHSGMQKLNKLRELYKKHIIDQLPQEECEEL